MQVLYINACVRVQSRTAKLAHAFIGQLPESAHITQLDLSTLALAPLNTDTLALRDQLLSVHDLQHPMLQLAHQFAQADRIIIAAPYWDFAFPALLKIYLEQVFVCGITFRYDEHGHPVGLCKARKLEYITTRGGCASGELAFLEMGGSYIRAMCQMFSIADFHTTAAEGLDIITNDASAILAQAIEQATAYAQEFCTP